MRFRKAVVSLLALLAALWARPSAAQDGADKGADKVSIVGLVAAPSPFSPPATPLGITASFKVRASAIKSGGPGESQTHHVRASIVIQNAQGAEVRTLTGETQVEIPPDTKGNTLIPVQIAVTWDGKDGAGLALPNGIYTIVASGTLLKRKVNKDGSVTETLIDTSETATTSATLSSGELDTSLTQFPPSQTNSSAATFAFTSNVAGATYERSLDNGAYVVASSPETITGLADGLHTYRVRAVDASGNVDPTPASYTWTIDTVPPDTSLTQMPPPQSGSTSAVFSFSSPETGVTFRRSLDGGTPVLVTSPDTITGLLDGPHTYQVMSVDAAGNVDPSPASWSWTVDTVPPDTSITQAPPALSNSKSATFVLAATETGCTFERSVDGGAFAVVTSPDALVNLTDGAHTYAVRAIDRAGNVDPTPATYTWTVDTTPPNVTLTQVPANPSNSATAVFAFTSNESGSTFQRSLDGAAFVAVTSPETLTGLADGTHTYQVRAVDPAGNADAVPASCTWMVDTTPPTIVGGTTPPANASGWQKSDVTVHFTASDAGSGVASFTPDSVVSAEGAGQIVQGTATDKVGNTAAASVTVNLDKTAPSLSVTIAPLPNADGWNNGNVTVHFEATDALSGIDVVTPDAVVSDEGAGQVISGSATDKAGNAAAGSVTLNVDKTPPAVSYTQDPPAKATGWNNTPVTVHFTATDALSGVASVGPDVVVSAEGAGQAVSGMAVDKAGNSATVTASVNLDLSPPVLQLSPADGQPVNGTQPMLSVSYADGLSGVDLSSLVVLLDGTDVTANCVILAGGATYTPGTPLSMGQHAFQATVRDLAGNLQTALSNFQLTVQDVPPPPTIYTYYNMSRSNTPYLNGETVPGVTTIKLYEGGVLIGSGAPSWGTYWSFQTTAVLSDGIHAIYATASNAAGESGPSETFLLTVDTVPPAPPKGLTVRTQAGGMVLTWQPNTETDLLGYNIYRKGPSDSDYIKINPYVVAEPRYFDNVGLEKGRTYSYKVTAVDDTYP